MDEKVVIKKWSKVWDLSNCTENDLTKQTNKKKTLVFIISHLHLFWLLKTEFFPPLLAIFISSNEAFHYFLVFLLPLILYSHLLSFENSSYFTILLSSTFLMISSLLLLLYIYSLGELTFLLLWFQLLHWLMTQISLPPDLICRSVISIFHKSSPFGCLNGISH